MADAQIFAGAFAEPVFGAQAVFRTVMDCMARPGTVGQITTHAKPPLPLGAAAGAVALTLCDHDTPVWLTPQLAKSKMPGWLAFHTGATIATEKQDARFAFVERGAIVPGFGLFCQGTQEYPDRSTTILVEIDAFEGGRPLVLAGPGIEDEARIAPKGLPDTFLSLAQANRALFPRGVDLILVAEDQIVCLPRTTVIRNGEA
jgi:alpha-D-ribose 1-methylphosphonate 5-triphosphate synthase subunit PhnH